MKKLPFRIQLHLNDIQHFRLVMMKQFYQFHHHLIQIRKKNSI